MNAVARAPSIPSAIGLVVANVVPLIGVMYFDWSLFGVMWLYWAETGVIGAFALLRILSADDGALPQRIALGVFFCIHFGMFFSVHGVFVATLFGGDVGSAAQSTLRPWEGLVPLIASHGLSFVVNYIVRGERKAATISVEMGKPYGRVVLLHVVILAAGFMVMFAGGGVLALALFVVLKTALDLGIHWVGHVMRFRDLEAAEPDASSKTIHLEKHPTARTEA
ncbi:DUF6498-containing protein [Rubrivirga sp.]|uniref:DUF6498-containing protein n=1 Tax=Rubrivirga sp. TaxID=1885344 RepID=UPI003C753D0F